MADDIANTALSAKQFNAIGSLMATANVRQAAKDCGISERTLFRWLQLPAFQEEYRLARRAATQAAIARLQQVSGAAVGVLVHLMASSSPAVKLGAARTILEFAIKATEIEDLQRRLEELERRFGT